MAQQGSYARRVFGVHAPAARLHEALDAAQRRPRQLLSEDTSTTIQGK
jgi:hypothetical protein